MKDRQQDIAPIKTKSDRPLKGKGGKQNKAISAATSGTSKAQYIGKQKVYTNPPKAPQQSSEMLFEHPFKETLPQAQ